jgi:hypothetical protein
MENTTMTDPTDPAEHAHVVDMHALHEATEAAKAAGVTDIQAVNERWCDTHGSFTGTIIGACPECQDEAANPTPRRITGEPPGGPADPAVPVPGPDTPTWTIGDDIIVWLSGDGAVRRSDVANDEAFDALVADVRAARAHEREVWPQFCPNCATAFHADGTFTPWTDAARAHEHCGPAADILQQARELIAEYAANHNTMSVYGFLARLTDLLVDGGGDD